MVSVVVRGAPGAEPAAESAVVAAGGTVVRPLRIIDGLAARVPADAVARLRTSPSVREITPDRPLHLQSLPQSSSSSSSSGYNQRTDVGSAFNTTLMTGAQAYWQSGYTGRGIDIALIDSGVVPVNGLRASGKVVNGPDLSFESQASNLRYRDTFGHGTHMAGLIAGRDDSAIPGRYAGDSVNFIGMAPDARIVSIKVADARGNTDVSQVLAAIDWVVQHRADPGMNIRVVSMSFGTDSYQSYLYDPLTYAAETAWHNGIVVVAAAGNSGWKTGLIDPADDPYVIAVGAADTRGTPWTSSHVVATFSAGGDGNRNPDLVAPGIHLESLRDTNSYLDATYPGARITSRFFRGSGTSQATAVVAGAAALILSQNPLLPPDQVKSLLTSSATPLPRQPAVMQGAGEIDLWRALHAVPPLFAEVWAPSTGTGSLEGARGSLHVSHNGVALRGETDIMGSPVNTAMLAWGLSHDTAWAGGSFNGVVWAGQGWAGNEWASAAWTGNTWAGDTWSSAQWSSAQWSSDQWSSAQWSSAQWSSAQWSSAQWSSAQWSSAQWG